MKICLVGGSGFIGTATSKLFHTKGYDFNILDINQPTASELLKYWGYVDVLDYTNYFNLISALKPTILFYFPAVHVVTETAELPLHACDLNIRGLYNTLDICRKLHIKIVFPSTVHVYQLCDTDAVDESCALNLNTKSNIYSSSKICGEVLVRSFNDMFDMDYIIMRYGSAYGVNCRGGIAKAAFVDKILNKEPVRIFGDINQSRNFLNVKDHALANDRIVLSGIKNEIINFDGSERLTLSRIINDISVHLDEPARIEYCGEVKNIYKNRNVSISKANQILGWAPTVNWGDGLSEYVEHRRNNR